MNKFKLLLVGALIGVFSVIITNDLINRFIINTVKKIPTSTMYTIPKSNMEWLRTRQRFGKGMLKSFKAEYTIQGELISVKEEAGKIEGLNDYYVEEKGNYIYGAKLTLKHQNNTKTIYFSKPRLSLIKIYRYNYSQNRYQEIKLSELKQGSYVEITEAVDLAIDSINDKNVLYLSIYEFKR